MTQTLKQGDRGALVSLLQLGLTRAGQTPGALDGIFGAQTAAAVRAFQAASALTPDGIAGARTHRALLPYYTGFVTRTIRAGDTFFALARQYGTSVDAIALANPYLAYALLIHAGLDGVERGLTPPPPVNCNLFCAGESVTSGLEALPATLDDARKRARERAFLRKYLPEFLVF